MVLTQATSSYLRMGVVHANFRMTALEVLPYRMTPKITHHTRSDEFLSFFFSSRHRGEAKKENARAMPSIENTSTKYFRKRPFSFVCAISTCYTAFPRKFRADFFFFFFFFSFFLFTKGSVVYRIYTCRCFCRSPCASACARTRGGLDETGGAHARSRVARRYFLITHEEPCATTGIIRRSCSFSPRRFSR